MQPTRDDAAEAFDLLKTAYDEACPALIDRQAIFRALLRSVSFCEQVGSPAWSLSLLPGGFRLNVGQVEALSCVFSFVRAGQCGIDEDVRFADVRFLVSGPAAAEAMQAHAPQPRARAPHPAWRSSWR